MDLAQDPPVVRQSDIPRCVDKLLDERQALGLKGFLHLPWTRRRRDVRVIHVMWLEGAGQVLAREQTEMFFNRQELRLRVEVTGGSGGVAASAEPQANLVTLRRGEGGGENRLVKV